MNVEIINRVLPGIGVCQEVELQSGHRLGIVTRRNGLREIVVYDDDGDGAAMTLALTDDEANALAEVLGAPKLILRLAELQQQADGLVTEQLHLPAGSPYASRPLGDTQARTRTGASIVAILRQGSAFASPTPDFVLRAGDLVVTVGTREGVDQVGHILAGAVGTGAPPGTG
ncbi:MAG: TrkA C-terminal domain-containing protein [Jatrophihabitantaceae bacterium]